MRVAVLMPEMFAARPDVRRALLSCRRGAAAAGHDVEEIADPSEALICDLMVLWGVGHPEMATAAETARRAGAHVLSLDLGYWGRGGPGAHYRISIDAPHPQALVMLRDRDESRFAANMISLRDEFDPAGPIVLVGMGWKSARQYGEPVGEWEASTAAALAERFPGRHIAFRPKPGVAQHCQRAGSLAVDTRPIAEVLRGASLVVCRHSNVAIDAIVAGVPVVTEGGAAAAVCQPHAVAGQEPLDSGTRRRFLANLAWFQWTSAELSKAETWGVFAEMIADLEA